MVRWSDSISRGELLRFLRQFTLLLEASLPLPELVRKAVDLEDNPVLRDCLRVTKYELDRGASLPMVWSRFPRLFPDSLISYLNLGHESGRIPEALREYLDFASRNESHTFVVWSAFVSLLSILAGLALFLFYTGNELYSVWAYTGYYRQSESLSVIRPFLSLDILLLVVAILWLPLRHLLRNVSLANLRPRFSRVKLMIPAIGRALYKNDLARFLRAVRIGLVSGLPMELAGRCAAETVENKYLAEELNGVVRNLQGGNTLSMALQTSTLRLPYLQSALETAENGGELDLVLAGQAEIYVQEAETVFRRATGILEPIVGLLGFGMLGLLGYTAFFSFMAFAVP